MKYIYSILFAGSLGLLATFTTSCDWSSGGGSNDFNTSQGAGVNVNWSGVYFGQISGRAVANNSGAGALTRLVLSQGGNRVEVVDNQGSRYVGSVGAPGAVSTGPNGVLSAGATLVEAQITFSGKDEVAAKDIEFVGILHVVAVEDIQGSTTEKVDVKNEGGGFPTITNTTVVIQQTPNGVETNIFEEIIEGSVENDSSTETTTTTTTFQITEANSQYRLQGTWIESGGVSANVDALSPGGIATITETATN